MGIKKQSDIWICDLCGDITYDNGEINPPWIKIEQEFYIEPDRYKIICWHCCNEIKGKMEKD